jgi:hypothetical protein
MNHRSKTRQGRNALLHSLPDASTLNDLKAEILNSAPGCLLDRELFDGSGDTAESEEDRAAREAAARDVCAECPARRLCLIHALATRPDSGIWAGLTAQELAPMIPAAALRTPGKPRTPHYDAISRGFGEVA